MTIQFEASIQDSCLIDAIVDRTVEAWPTLSRSELNMDITACHCNGCPLNLDKLLRFSYRDLSHDIFGIRRNIDRTTGKLLDCFCPRSAVQ